MDTKQEKKISYGVWIFIGVVAILGLVVASSQQTVITAGDITTVGDITADELKLSNNLNMSPDKSLNVYSDTSDHLGVTPQAIALHNINPQSKSYLAWYGWYDNGTTMVEDWVGWFGCHYNTSITPAAHQHCSIETLDTDTGYVNTRFEILYGKSVATTYAGFTNINYVNFGSNVDLRFSSPADIFPNNQNTIGLRVNSTTIGDLELSALGSSNISMTDDLKLVDSSLYVYNSAGKLPAPVTGDVARFVRNSATSNAASIGIIGGNATGSSIVNFGDENNGAMGSIKYTHADNQLKMYVSALTTPTMNISTSGVFVNNIFTIVPKSAAPATPQAGMVYYDSDTNTMCLYNSTVWLDMTGRGLTCA